MSFNFRFSPVLLMLMTSSAYAAPLQICVDKIPNPPFAYSEKIQGAGKLKGYSLDIIQKALKTMAIPYAVKLVSSAEIAKKMQDANPNAGCDIALDVQKGSSLESSVLLTHPIYRLHFDLVYNWETYMSGLGIKNLADMNKFNVCGVKNVDYSALNKQLKIQEHNTIKDVMFNIKAKECDVFVAEGVLMRYGQRANQYQVPPVGCIRLSGTEKSYHIAVSKHVPNASNFVGQIQQAIGTLSKDIAVLAEEYDVNPIKCQQTLNIN